MRVAGTSGHRAAQFCRLKHGSAVSLEQALMTILRWMMNGAIPTLAAVSACRHVTADAATASRRVAHQFSAALRHMLREAVDEELAHRPLSQTKITFLLGYSEESASSRAYRLWTEGYRAQSVALGWRLCEAANEPRIGSRLPAGERAGHKDYRDRRQLFDRSACGEGAWHRPAQIEKRSVSESAIRRL